MRRERRLDAFNDFHCVLEAAGAGAPLNAILPALRMRGSDAPAGLVD
jgi:hypothetical protein